MQKVTNVTSDRLYFKVSEIEYEPERQKQCSKIARFTLRSVILKISCQLDVCVCVCVPLHWDYFQLEVLHFKILCVWHVNSVNYIEICTKPAAKEITQCCSIHERGTKCALIMLPFIWPKIWALSLSMLFAILLCLHRLNLHYQIISFDVMDTLE